MAEERAEIGEKAKEDGVMCRSMAGLQEMIEEEVQEVRVDREIIVKQEALARKSYKIRDWVKLYSLLELDMDYARIDAILAEDMHHNFLIVEGFWAKYVHRKLNTSPDRSSIELCMLALDDGPYNDLAILIAEKVLLELQQGRLRPNFCLSILQKLINLFDHDSTAAPHFFKLLRAVYQHMGNTSKIRQTYIREIKKAYNDFDLTFDEYMHWEQDEGQKKKHAQLYQVAKKRWSDEQVEFDQHLASELNIRRSLFRLENVNEVKIDEKRYNEWLEKLPTEQDKLWFLRRMVLLNKQMFAQYLHKLQIFYINDPDEMIKHYHAVLRISQNSTQIQDKFLAFMVRRINKHLLSQDVEPTYYDSWGEKVTFFRIQIRNLITKERKTPAEQSQLTIKYYRYWIEVEENIIKDKETLCKLYEQLLKNSDDLTIYEDYARSLVNMGAFKDARNVLNRYIFHDNSLHSKQYYIRFIGIYGDLQDQIIYLKEERVKSSKKEEQSQKKLKDPVPEKEKKMVAEAEPLKQQSPLKPVQTEIEGVKRPRDTFNDDLEEKIESKMRKKLHIDGQFTVYVKGIPLDWKQSDILRILKKPQSVARISLIVKNNEQRDYCYIEYNSKEAAEEEVSLNDSGYVFKISRPPGQYDESKTLFLCALPSTATEDKLKQLFGEHAQNISEIRLKLEKDKNYAYVDFHSKEAKDTAYQSLIMKNLLIDSKKVLMQHCDSSRMRNKKFIQVVFLKNLAFKVEEKDITNFFQGKNITKISIPKNEKGISKGFAYVQFEKFKDYQQALDLKKGQLLGRQFLIFKSDREISQQRKPSTEQERPQQNPKPKQPSTSKHQKTHQPRDKPSSNNTTQNNQGPRDNSFFSNLFKK